MIGPDVLVTVGPRYVRHDVQHRNADCYCRDWWERRAWGDRICLKCFPPADPFMVVRVVEAKG